MESSQGDFGGWHLSCSLQNDEKDGLEGGGRKQKKPEGRGVEGEQGRRGRK